MTTNKTPQEIQHCTLKHCCLAHDNLDVNIKDTDLALGGNFRNACNAGPVEVAMHFGKLHHDSKKETQK